MGVPAVFCTMASEALRRGLGTGMASALVLISALCATASPQDHTYAETILHSFANTPDGKYPNAGLLMDAKGNLYGATEGRGDSSRWNGV